MKTSYGEFRLTTLREIAPDYHCDQPPRLAAYYREVIAPSIDPCKEHLHVILLNNRMRVLGHTMVSIGGANECLAHPREVFRAAIIGSAISIAMVHNHPSGDPSPSEADIRLTRRMLEVGKIVGITLVDHLVMAGDKHCSLRELGHIRID